jgi:hypothetical protein
MVLLVRYSRTTCIISKAELCNARFIALQLILQMNMKNTQNNKNNHDDGSYQRTLLAKTKDKHRFHYFLAIAKRNNSTWLLFYNCFKPYIGKQLGLDPRSGRQNAREKFSMGIIALTSSNFVMYRINKTSARSD